MSARFRLVLLALGAAMLWVLVRRVGVGELLANAATVGWMFIPVLVLYGTMLVFNAFAWHLTLAGEAARPPFPTLLSLTVSGAALNFVTPVINAGGEPFRVAGLVPYLGSHRAAASVILIRMLNTLALILTWFTALVLALVLVPLHGVLLAGVLVAAAAALALSLLVFTGHQEGVLERLLDGLHRTPLLGRLGRRAEAWRGTLAEMDRQIAEFYHRSPRRFFQALAVEYVARAMLMGEYYLVGLGLGIPMSLTDAYLVGGLASLVQNIIFLIPYEVGVKEGALFLLFQLVGLDPTTGLATALVIRARDLAWIGIGLLLVGVVPHPSPEPGSPA
jgi:uncharacterized protein (TIRG00374 family)